MTRSQMAHRGVVGLALVWLFSAVFYSNVLGLGVRHEPGKPNQRPDNFEVFQTDSEISVTLMMEKAKRDGFWSSGGFMLQRKIDDPPYLSAWGLQGKLFSLMYLLSDQTLPAVVDRGHLIVSIVFALIMTWLVMFAWWEWGAGTATVLVAGICLSGWLVFAAKNLFLLYGLHLLPFILSITLMGLVRPGGRFGFPAFILVVSAAVLLKSLCYLDYSSNIVLSTAIGPLYFGVKESRPWRTIGKQMLVVLLAASAAVSLAIVLTCIQAGFWLHSMPDGFRQMLNTVDSRMYGTNLQDKAAPAAISVFRILEQYLFIPAISMPLFGNDQYVRIYFSLFAALVLWIPFGMVALLDGQLFPAIARERSTLRALSLSALWGMGATLSWGLLMKGHMWHHLHMNGMIFYIPYMLMLYILIGKVTAILSCHSVYVVLRGYGARKLSSLHNATAIAREHKPQLRK